MDKIKKILQDNKKIIFGGAILSLLAGGAYYLTRNDPSEFPQEQQQQSSSNNQSSQSSNTQQQTKSSQPERPTNQTQQTVQPVESFKDDSNRRSKIQQIAKRISIRYIGNTNILEIQSISQILESSIDLAEVEYVKVTLRNREERRACMHVNQQKYEELVLVYNDQIERVLEEAQEELLNELNIDKNAFEESVMYLMEQGLYQQIYMLQAAIRQKVKEKLKSHKEVSMEQTKDIIKYQVSLLNDKPEFFQSIINKLRQNPENMQMIPMVLNTLLQDFIFEKFQIEEEDQMKNMMVPNILQDPDIAQSLMQIEEAMFKLMNSLDLNL